jgi:rSAM/selenodomain-associated transferase 1
MTSAPAVIVIAKAPVPGRCKTRLCPPCTPYEAAQLAAAALRDTIRAVGACRAARKVVALDGRTGNWLPSNFEVIPQRGPSLDKRIASAFMDVGQRALLVGMDTPQLTPEILDDALSTLAGADAVLGHTFDGGFWAVGLQEPSASAFVGVPMSTTRTGAEQQHRLENLGLEVANLTLMRDVDYIADAIEVASLEPNNLFATTLAAMDLQSLEGSRA